MISALLLSGGMDSLAIAWWLRPEYAITISYGQLAAKAEIAASAAICKRLHIEHHVIDVDCSSLGSGDMAGSKADPLAPASDWWPFRNQLLITLAGMRAISLGVGRLLIGTVKSDAQHCDGSPEFIDSIDSLLKYQEGHLSVHAPAIHLSTADLVRASGIPLYHLAWAHSCHGGEVACGKCRGCNKYYKVFEELGHDLDKSG